MLGSLLFLLYSNDFCNSAPGLHFHLLADDSSIFYSHKNSQCLETKLNIKLKNVHELLCTSKLSLNIDN